MTRDPERAADLAEAVQHAGADAGLVDRHGAHRGRGHRRHRHRHPDAAEQHRRQQRPEGRVQPRPAGRGAARCPRSVIPPPISQREPIRSESRPAIGAIEDDQERHRQEGRAGLRRASSRGCSACRARRRRRRRTSRARRASRRCSRRRTSPFRNSERSSIGSRCCSSSTTNATSSDDRGARRDRGSRATSSRSGCPRSARR